MNMLKRNCTLLMGLIVSITSLLHADQEVFNLCDEELKYQNLYDQYQESYIQPSSYEYDGGINTCPPVPRSSYLPAPICCEAPSGGFFVRGDILYWNTHLSGLELNFGTSSISESIEDGFDVFTTEEEDIDPHYKWKAGYRLAAGYRSGSNNWGVDSTWTHFHNDGTRSSSFLNRGECKLKFDQVDLILAYYSPLSSSFIFKPYLGVRAANIREEVDAQLVTSLTLSDSSLASETRLFDDTQKFRGIGPIFGLEGSWEIGCGFGFYGTAAASVLYGTHKVHFNDIDTFTAPISTVVISNNKRHVHTFNWNVDLALGIEWQFDIYESLQLGMRLGFEHHQFFNHNHLGTSRGDLSLDGGVFSVCLTL